jgi:hypothetical protein
MDFENCGCDLDANSLDFVEKEFSKVEDQFITFHYVIIKIKSSVVIQ